VNTRRINQLLHAAAALLAAGTVAVFVFGLTLPLDSSEPRPPQHAAASSNDGGAALPSIASLEPLWDLHLRSELTPAAPSQQQPARLAADAAPVPPNLPISLVGTIGDSLAILRHESGQVEVRAAGEHIAGVEVLDVRPARVQVRHNGQVTTLRKPVDVQGGL
jgi:hypothetical protein